MNCENEQGSRESYVKPELKVIKLNADEVLGFGCKTAFLAPGQTGTCDLAACSTEFGS